MKGKRTTTGETINGTEAGAALILVALLIVFLIGMVGFALDVNIARISSTQLDNIAENVARGSLKTFMKTDGDYLDRLEAARARAEQIANSNFYLGQGFLEDPDLEQTIGTLSEDDYQAVVGFITPGIWHPEPPTGGCEAPTAGCPCPDGVWMGQCFEEVDLDAGPVLAAAKPPNAIRATLYTAEDSPLRTVLVRVLGQAHVSLAAEATAHTSPRDEIILMPLTRFTTEETHLLYERLSYQDVHCESPGCTPTGFKLDSGEYAFRLTDSCPAAMPPCPLPIGTCGFASDRQGQVYNDHVGPLLGYPNERPAGAQPAISHYKTDYTCFDVTYTEGAGSKTESYIIDTFQGVTDTGADYAPEPLYSILNGVNQAVDLLETNGIPGDRLGVLAYDKSVDIEERTFELSQVGSVTLETLKTITDVEAETEGSRGQRINRMLFPRIEDGNNLPRAILRAIQMFEENPPDYPTVRSITVLGDALVNCTANGACEFSAGKHAEALAEINEIVESELIERNIQLNFIPLGSAVGVHTKLVSTEEGGTSCTDSTEALAHDPPVSLVDTTKDSAEYIDGVLMDNLHYFEGNALFYAAQKTHGLWLPIQDCCRNDEGECESKDSEVYEACVAAPPLTTVNVSDVTENGRLMCDSLGRTKRVQIREHLEKVLFGNARYQVVSE